MKTKKTSDSFAYAAHECPPQQAVLVASINSYIDLKEKGASLEKLGAQRVEVERNYENFCKDAGHSNAPWIFATIRAIADAAYEDLDAAVAGQKKAKEKAMLPLELAKNENNLCDVLRRLALVAKDAGRKRLLLDEAVENGFSAVARSEGENVGMVITLAQALCLRGDNDEADALLKVVFQNATVGRAGDAATAHLKFDAGFRAMSHLPSVARALQQLE